jgi:hypothetical protein
MKKLLFLILFIITSCCCCYCKAQDGIRIGKTESEILKEFPKAKIVYDTYSRFLQQDFGDYVMAYVFSVDDDKNTPCKINMLFPDGSQVIAKLIENFNTYYVIISDTLWKLYDGGKTINVMLLYNMEKDFYYVSYKSQ